MSDYSKFFELFEKVESWDDLPVGTNLIIWDGCGYQIACFDIDVDFGQVYSPDGLDMPLAYFELPCCDESMDVLGDGE